MAFDSCSLLLFGVGFETRCIFLYTSQTQHHLVIVHVHTIVMCTKIKEWRSTDVPAPGGQGPSPKDVEMPSPDIQCPTHTSIHPKFKGSQWNTQTRAIVVATGARTAKFHPLAHKHVPSPKLLQSTAQYPKPSTHSPVPTANSQQPLNSRQQQNANSPHTGSHSARQQSTTRANLQQPIANSQQQKTHSHQTTTNSQQHSLSNSHRLHCSMP